MVADGSGGSRSPKDDTPTPRSAGEFAVETTKLLRKSLTLPSFNKQLSKRNLLLHEHMIVQSLTPFVRVLGVFLGFCSMVFSWEAIDNFIIHRWPKVENQVLAYLVLDCGSILLVTVSHLWTRHSTERVTIPASFFYSLSTMFLACASWGGIAALARLLIPERGMLAFWAVGAFLFLLFAFAYSMATHHNALLDIVACALSMGLMDNEVGEEDEHEGQGTRATPWGPV